MCLHLYPPLEYLLLECNLCISLEDFSSPLLLPANLCNRPLLSSHREEYITIYLHFLWLSTHPSFILAVSCQSPFLVHALPDKSKTPSLLWVCVHVHFQVSVFPCAVGWQQVTVSNGPDLKVGSCCVCACACVLVRERCAWVCVSNYDSDSWEGTGRCSTPFRPDAPVTSWPCSLLSTSLSIQQEVEGG